MTEPYTKEKLTGMSSEEKDLLILSMQKQLEALNDNINKLIEQMRIANQQRFGRHSEKMDVLDGQLSLFDEAGPLYDPKAEEPKYDDVVPDAKTRRKKQKGKRDADLDSFEQETYIHDVSKEKLDEYFGKGNWREMPVESYKRLRYVPSKFITENHKIKVYVGISGDHQDEFMRGDHTKDLLRNSILTPSLAAAILNGKYVNSLPFNRIEAEFKRNAVNISRQNMANWTIYLAEYYFIPFCDRMKYHLLKFHVNQCDETPTQVLNDGKSPGSKSYMWVHRSGEFYKDKQIVLYEYQKGRDHNIPCEFYKDFEGYLVTDGLQQYHPVAEKNKNIKNANCWAHARRDYADAVNAAKADFKDDHEGLKKSVAYQALVKIGKIYKAEEDVKNLSVEERLKVRQTKIKPLVDDYFTWVKDKLNTTLPKGKTAEGLKYSINQEKYLRKFLEDGEVPIDNSASERAIRTFCIGKKNWLFFDSVRGAEAGAAVYSITETAKLNNLSPYKYLEYLLTELAIIKDATPEGKEINPEKFDKFMPWSLELPDSCRKPSH